MAAAAVEDPVVPNDDDDAVVDEQERRRRDRQAAMERMLLAQEQRDADTEDNLAAENPAQMGRVDPEGDGVAAAAAAAAEDAVANNDNDLQVQLLNQHQQHQHQAQLQEQQPKTLRALSYTQTSFCAAGALLYYALRTRQQWYLALVYLSSSKLALVVMFNALTAGAVTSFDIVTNTFLSGLRLQEAEGLQDFFRWNVTETCLALTMFRSELSASTAVQFLILVTVKCLHHVAILREQHVRMTEDAIVETTFGIGGIKLALIPLQHVKLLAMLVFLQLVDIMALQFTVQDLLTNGPTVSVLFAFEAAILLVAAWSHILLWYLHVTDSWLNYNHERAPTSFFGRMLHPWKEYKATLIFAVELQAQLIQFIFYMVFFRYDTRSAVQCPASDPVYIVACSSIPRHPNLSNHLSYYHFLSFCD
jgi:E3 ubiquitin-protein ligase synoviolin